MIFCFRKRTARAWLGSCGRPMVGMVCGHAGSPCHAYLPHIPTKMPFHGSWRSKILTGSYPCAAVVTRCVFCLVATMLLTPGQIRALFFPLRLPPLRTRALAGALSQTHAFLRRAFTRTCTCPHVHTQACVVGTKHVVVFGGCDDRKRPFNDIHILDCAYKHDQSPLRDQADLSGPARRPALTSLQPDCTDCTDLAAPETQDGALGVSVVRDSIDEDDDESRPPTPPLPMPLPQTPDRPADSTSTKDATAKRHLNYHAPNKTYYDHMTGHARKLGGDATSGSAIKQHSMQALHLPQSTSPRQTGQGRRNERQEEGRGRTRRQGTESHRPQRAGPAGPEFADQCVRSSQHKARASLIYESLLSPSGRQLSSRRRQRSASPPPTTDADDAAANEGGRAAAAHVAPRDAITDSRAAGYYEYSEYDIGPPPLAPQGSRHATTDVERREKSRGGAKGRDKVYVSIATPKTEPTPPKPIVPLRSAAEEATPKSCKREEREIRLAEKQQVGLLHEPKCLQCVAHTHTHTHKLHSQSFTHSLTRRLWLKHLPTLPPRPSRL